MKRILSDAELADEIFKNIQPVAYRLPSGARIELRSRFGDLKWVVIKHGMILNNRGEFEYEPLPINSDDSFISRCRFNSVKDACLALAWNEQGGKDAAQG